MLFPESLWALFLFQRACRAGSPPLLVKPGGVTPYFPGVSFSVSWPSPRFLRPLTVLDRITDRAHIIETGTESFRFRRTFERSKKH
jgi:hypothetical protein